MPRLRCSDLDGPVEFDGAVLGQAEEFGCPLGVVGHEDECGFAPGGEAFSRGGDEVLTTDEERCGFRVDLE